MNAMGLLGWLPRRRPAPVLALRLARGPRPAPGGPGDATPAEDHGGIAGPRETAVAAPVTRGLRALTADGTIEISPELQKVMVILSDGSVKVSATHLDRADVEATLTRAAEAGHLVGTVEPATMEEIAVWYRSERRASRTAVEMEKRVATLVGLAHKTGASDIHAWVDGTSMQIRFRIHGNLTPVLLEYDQGDGMQMLGAAYNMMDQKRGDFSPRESLMGRLADRVGDYGLPASLSGVRMQFNHVARGNHLAMRLLSRDSIGRSASFQTLGYSQAQALVLSAMLNRSDGAVLLSGPTGSGKSTTIEVAIEEWQRRRGYRTHAMTVEDPAELDILSATQVSVTEPLAGEDRGEQWAIALKSALRSDPDLLMIGELRDAITADAAVQGSISGHFVLSTVHTKDALVIPYRLRQFGVEDWQLFEAELVVGLVQQRLLPVLCQKCKVPLLDRIRAGDTNAILIGQRLAMALRARNLAGDISTVALAGPGCEHCALSPEILDLVAKARRDGQGLRPEQSVRLETGVKGRTVVAEIVVPNDDLNQLLKKDRFQDARAHWLQSGGVPMLDHALTKVMDGLVSPIDVDAKIRPLDTHELVRKSLAAQLGMK